MAAQVLRQVVVMCNVRVTQVGVGLWSHYKKEAVLVPWPKIISCNFLLFSAHWLITITREKVGGPGSAAAFSLQTGAVMHNNLLYLSCLSCVLYVMLHRTTSENNDRFCSQRNTMACKSITPGADTYMCGMFYRYMWLGSLLMLLLHLLPAVISQNVCR